MILRKPKNRCSDFTQCKTELTCTLNDCQPVKSCAVVSSLPAHSRGPRKQSNSLVITNHRCLESNLSRHLGNRQFGHSRSPLSDQHPDVDRFFTKSTLP